MRALRFPALMLALVACATPRVVRGPIAFGPGAQDGGTARAVAFTAVREAEYDVTVEMTRDGFVGIAYVVPAQGVLLFAPVALAHDEPLPSGTHRVRVRAFAWVVPDAVAPASGSATTVGTETVGGAAVATDCRPGQTVLIDPATGAPAGPMAQRVVAVPAVRTDCVVAGGPPVWEADVLPPGQLVIVSSDRPIDLSTAVDGLRELAMRDLTTRLVPRVAERVAGPGARWMATAMPR